MTKTLPLDTVAAELSRLRATSPLVHLLTNEVVQEITANVLLAAGASPAMIVAFSNTPVRKYFSAMKKPQIVAFSTASSMATLPVNMETCEHELKVTNATASFVLPLGATINMSGNAIYYGLVAIFFAQVYNIDLSMGAWAAIILTSTLGAIGQAGVPGPSFLVVAVLLAAGIPIEGLPLLFALDRLFDMIRTALNITGDAACAIIVDRYSPDYDPNRWSKEA